MNAVCLTLSEITHKIDENASTKASEDFAPMLRELVARLEEARGRRSSVLDVPFPIDLLRFIDEGKVPACYLVGLQFDSSYQHAIMTGAVSPFRQLGSALRETCPPEYASELPPPAS